MCRFKTSPCVGSKRFRVYRQNACMCSTCARFAGTHGSVLNLHTETFRTYTREFSACQAAPHTPQTQPNTHHTHQHTPTHTQRTHHIHQHTHQHTPKHKTHIPHTLITHAQSFQHTRTTHDTTRTHTRTHTNAWTRAQSITDRDLETKK